jgi:hypothetical protein
VVFWDCRASVEFLEEVADRAAKQSCCDVALVSPVVCEPNEIEGQSTDEWMTYVTISEKGGYGVVLGVRRFDQSGGEAEVLRQKLVAALRRRFAQVHVCETEVEAAKLLAKLWPGELSRKIEAEKVADCASRPNKVDPVPQHDL